MGGSGVIDTFLGTFTRYIDSGFGLLGGEVAFVATTLIVIDVTLAALFWSWGADDDIIARLVKKTLFVGVFAYLISNWNNLAKIVFDSFAGLVAQAMAQQELRRTAAAKFSRAAEMLFTRGGYEQSSSEAVAGYRAGRLHEAARAILAS